MSTRAKTRALCPQPKFLELLWCWCLEENGVEEPNGG